MRMVMSTLEGDHDVIEKNDYVVVDNEQVSDRPLVWFVLAW